MDNLTVEQRRRNMQNIRSKDTLPERLLMRELRRRKIYFAKNVDSVLGKPDILFRRKKIAVFIDSDFWHGHPKRFVMPKTNSHYWRKKIKDNKKRDLRINKELRKDGWTVLRFWEYDVKHSIDKCVNRIITTRE